LLHYIGFAMPQKPDSSTLVFTVGLLASAAIHSAILAPLVLDLPTFEPDPEVPIEVELDLPAEQNEQEKIPVSANLEKVKPPQLIRPVYRFGEKDTGPQRRNDGNSDGASAAALPSQEQARRTDAPERTDGEPAFPETDSTTIPMPKPANKENPMRPEPEDGPPAATTAMAEIPRGVRAGELCVTELRHQLQNSLPPYWPDLLPTYRLDKGTLLQVRQGAFRANARWYNLRFRCEIDEAATTVVSFGFEVGAPVPRTEWASRGFPSR
jgi:Domain of Unknown Function (DUF930)